MNTPEDCTSLAQVRAEIDRLDEQIVRLLAERGGYVLAAARFKHSAEEVPAPQRVEQVIANVRALALQHGAIARSGGTHLPHDDRRLHRGRAPALAAALIVAAGTA